MPTSNMMDRARRAGILITVVDAPTYADAVAHVEADMKRYPSMETQTLRASTSEQITGPLQTERIKMMAMPRGMRAVPLRMYYIVALDDTPCQNVISLDRTMHDGVSFDLCYQEWHIVHRRGSRQVCQEPRYTKWSLHELP